MYVSALTTLGLVLFVTPFTMKACEDVVACISMGFGSLTLAAALVAHILERIADALSSR